VVQSMMAAPIILDKMHLWLDNAPQDWSKGRRGLVRENTTIIDVATTKFVSMINDYGNSKPFNTTKIHAYCLSPRAARINAVSCCLS